MSKKKMILIIILLAIVAMISGLVVMFVSGLKEDQKEMNKRIDVIISGYDQLNKDIDEISNERDTIHKEILDTIYYETFAEKNIEYKKQMLKYEEDVTNLSKKNKMMKEYCNSGMYYSSSDANNKCQAFNLAYEQLINTFVNDVNLYNVNIKKFNDYLTSSNNTTTPKQEIYQTKKTYIDFNKDGEYSGKEDNNEEK